MSLGITTSVDLTNTQNNSLSSKVYNSLREKIISLEIQPGAELSEVNLAREYGVSRAPIRFALTKLQTENLVEIRPQIGTIVTPISIAETQSILEVRLLLEPYCAKIAARRMGDDDIKFLSEVSQKLNDLDNSKINRDLIVEADTLLHRTIWRLCGNPEIFKILSGYSDKVRRLQLSTAIYTKRLMPSSKEMVEIIDALQMKDEIGAEKAMYKHILNFKVTLVDLLFKMENSK